MSVRTKTSNPQVWIAGIALLAMAGYGLGPGHWFSKDSAVVLRGARVQRGPLRISVLQRGNLAAKDSVSITSEIEGQTTVIFMIKEGTIVKPGDLLVELDSSDLVEKKRQQEIAVQNADAAYTKAKAQYEIQESQNKSDIELADRRLQFAVIDQKKYLQGDLAQMTEQADQKILLAKQELKQAETTFTWSQSLSEKGFLTKSELDRDELSMNRSDVSLKQAERAKQILSDYDDPRKKTELDANVKEADRGLERARLKAQALIVDFEAGMNSSEARMKLEKEKLEKYEQQITKARIVSTVNGMVVYTRTDGGRMGGGETITEGSQVRERQEILTIPRTGGMIVEASIHESVLKQVALGLPCTVKVDALPGLEFQGKVHYVALLPDKSNWWANPNQRLYKTEIRIDDIHPDMRPGMSCNIEILAQQIPDTLYAPLQSVMPYRGETIAFLAHGGDIDQRKVKVGRNNEKWVEILDGLQEGEEVLLSPPPGFTPQGAGEKEKADGGGRGPNERSDKGDAGGNGRSRANGAAGGERMGPPGAGAPAREGGRTDAEAGAPARGDGAPARGDGAPGSGRRGRGRPGAQGSKDAASRGTGTDGAGGPSAAPAGGTGSEKGAEKDSENGGAPKVPGSEDATAPRRRD